MKRIYTIIVLAFISCTIIQVMGQKEKNYFPVLSEATNQWYLPVTQLFETWVDTIYSVQTSENYHELWYIGGWFYHEHTYLGKIRNNEDNSKLFYIAPDSVEEAMIMDLNLKVGDKFYNQNYPVFWEDSLVVDSVFEKDGLRHVQFNSYIPLWAPLGSEKATFIERVGPNWGFVPVATPFYFICKYEGENRVYGISNSYVENCNFKVISVVGNIKGNNKLIIHPNPTQDKVNIAIKTDSLPVGNIYVYNLLGELVLTSEVNEQNFERDITDLLPGSYILTYRVNNIILNRVLVKQ